MVTSASWLSEATQAVLDALSAQQARGVVRIVEARVLHGRGVNSLLDCPGQICATDTFYRRPRGWHHRPAFQRALALAETDLRHWIEAHALTEALAELKAGATEAVRELRRQVEGEAAALAELCALLHSHEPGERRRAALVLGVGAHAAAAEPLVAALHGEREADVRAAIIDALGQVAAAGNLGAARAASAILDRAGAKTAAKGAPADWRTEVIVLIRQRRVSFDALEEELGNDLATELFESAGVPVVAAGESAAGGPAHADG